MATTRKTARRPAKVPAKKAAKASANKPARRAATPAAKAATASASGGAARMTADARLRGPGKTSTPTVDDVAAQLQRTHAQLVAAITAGQGEVEEAMKLAEAAVAQAVRGAGEALRLAQKAAK